MTKYEQIRHHSDESFGVVNHILDSVAFASEKTIASIVLLLSMVPETIGVGRAMGYPVGMVSAAVSLVTVKLALRDKGKSLTLPVIGKQRIYFGWALYALNLTAGLAFVYSTGVWVDLFLIVVSFCGAVSSEQIAQVIKAEIRERSRADLQAERDGIKLAEMRAKSEARTAAYVAKHAPAAPEQPQAVTDVQPEQSVIPAHKNAEGRAKGLATQQTKKQRRHDDLYEMLLREYPGVALTDISYTDLGKAMSVSRETARRDIAALRNAGRINGVVPDVPTSSQ